MTTPNATTNPRDFACAPNVNVGDEIQLSGVRYLVGEVKTADDIRADGLDRLADRMIENGCYADLVCRRPRGSKLHLLRAFRNASGVLVFRHVLSL